MTGMLVVRAHPLSGEQSRTMMLVDAFIDAYSRSNPQHTVTEVRLYDTAIPEIDLDLLNGWEKMRAGTPFDHLQGVEQNKITLFDHYTDQFLAADKIVVANPLWNLQVPTRLKAWVDAICVGGKTFRYSENGEAIGLVRGKKALHIQTAGGLFGFQDPASQYIKSLFNFIGIEDFHQLNAEGMDHNPDKADEIMEDAKKRITDFAVTF